MIIHTTIKTKLTSNFTVILTSIQFHYYVNYDHLAAVLLEGVSLVT
jgi:hypothetical protein